MVRRSAPDIDRRSGVRTGTGTPEVGGPQYEALQIYRALAPVPFVGYDVVEVAPQQTDRAR